MENYTALIAAAIAPLAYLVLRYLLKQANRALKAVFPQGKLKDRLFREL